LQLGVAGPAVRQPPDVREGVFAAVPVIFYVVLSKRGGGASIFSGAVKG